MYRARRGAGLGARQRPGALVVDDSSELSAHEQVKGAWTQDEVTFDAMECLEVIDEALSLPLDPYDLRPARVRLRQWKRLSIKL